jgi:hypothetical protein
VVSFDKQLAARAAAVSGLAWLVAAVVVAATDEGQGWAPRAGLVAALAPIAGGIGAWTALGVAALRGEVRALAALGVPPARVSIGAACGGAAPALIGALLVAMPFVDLGALFPRPISSEGWERDGADLVARASGLRASPGGKLAFENIRSGFSLEAFRPSREAVAVALVAAAIALPLATSAPRGVWRRALALGAALAVAIAVFQAVAAGRVSAAWLAFAPLALLVDAAFAYHPARG